LLNGPNLPFDRAFVGLDLPSDATIVAAVSGGGDSVALLALLRDHLARHRPDVRQIAATVDHGLRPQSADEAASVGRLAASLGISHVVRRWLGDKPATGVAAAARAARYRLLGEIAGEFGAVAILTGHTADDQAETIAMRRQRGEGRGLAGMAPASLLDGGVWLLRPLLGVSRAALRRFLVERRLEWVEDPSNEDDRFERPRVRRDLTARPDLDDLLALGRAAARDREQLGIRSAAIIRALASRPAPGLTRLGLELLRHPDGDAAVYAMRILLAEAGGREHLPDALSVHSLLETLAQADGRRCATLARAVIDRRGDAIFLYRESRNLPRPAPLSHAYVWDGRYRIEGDAGPGAAIVRPFGRSGGDPEPLASTPMSILRTARAAEPALHRADGDPQLLDGARPVAAPWAALLPSFDLAPARAVAELVGVPIPPDPPYHGHSGSDDLTQS